jgi:hypothetical protein
MADQSLFSISNSLSLSQSSRPVLLLILLVSLSLSEASTVREYPSSNLLPEQATGDAHPQLQAYMNSTIKFNSNATLNAFAYGHAVLAGFETN